MGVVHRRGCVGRTALAKRCGRLANPRAEPLIVEVSAFVAGGLAVQYSGELVFALFCLTEDGGEEGARADFRVPV
jgi:hypothetical protein